MIGRYTIPPMGELWSDATKYEIWRDVEVAAATAMGAPARILEILTASPAPTPDEVGVEELVTRHDVMAFLAAWRKDMPADAVGWTHRNMTSSDLVDSANAVRLRYVVDEIQTGLARLLVASGRHAIAHKSSRRVARTHGQHAEVTTWGYRVADLFMGLRRAYDSLSRVVLTGKLSGPVGDYKYTSLEEELEFARLLGINTGVTATQVVLRDGYSELVFILSQIATLIEAFALEVRLSQRTEVGELFEGFGKGQKGSSAMPHKRNPIASEQLCGLAKLVRAQVTPIQEGIALHHEQDISHSSVERIALQTSTTLTHYMIIAATRLVDNLVVDVERMAQNLQITQGRIQSAHYRNWLVAFGIDPDLAWSLVAEAANTIPEDDTSGLALEHILMDLLRKRDITTPPYLPVVPEPHTYHVFNAVERLVDSFRNNGG